MKKLLAISLACILLIAAFAGCAASPSPAGNSPTPNDASPTPTGDGGEVTPGGEDDLGTYVPLASDVSGDISIMMWSGDGSYMEDLGHSDLAPEDLLGQNQGAAYATAKAFNEIYPNVKINIFAETGDPNGEPSWAQKMENFKAEHGKYPDLYAAVDVPGDIEKGLCADISIFKDDPVYKSFNPAVMAMMNYNGAQFALPQYLLPWGVFVNKSLADANNIDIPNYDWTIDDYTEFTAHSSPDEYYGAMDAPLDFVRTGVNSFVYNLVNRKTGDQYVDLNTPAVKTLLSYIPKWSLHAVNPQNDLGNVASEFFDGWAFNMLKDGKLLTSASDPWMMGDLANPTPGHWGAATYENWDIYPRPATEEVGNTVGVVLDPFCVHNYAMDDGDPALSDEEAVKLQVAYEFAKFWCGDSRAIKARAEQMFSDNGTLKTSLNDSLPLVTGDAFNEQMEIWGTVSTHTRFLDAEKMPGFQYVLQLWQEGKFADVSDKAYPWYYDYEGSRREIMYEWIRCWDVNVVGATRTDANWLDQMYALLPDWNTAFNERFAAKFVSIEKALTEYYGK